MPQNSNFWLLRGHRFGQKNRIYGYGAKSRWGPPRVHLELWPRSLIWAKNRINGYGAKSRWGIGSILGPMGSHWGQKMGQNRKKLPCPKIRIFYYSARSSIWAKNRIYGYGAKSRWGPPRVHLGANGVPLGQKMGQNRKKLPCPKIRIFYYSAVIDLGKKSNLRLWRQITVGTP